MTYSDKLRDPRWQRKKTEALIRDEFCCKHCKDKKETLQVHHIMYRKGLQPYDYELKDLITFCETCHKEVTDYKNLIKQYIELNFINPTELVEICELMFYVKKLNLTEVKQLTNEAKIISENKIVKDEQNKNNQEQ